jgi:hypothetical protein
MVSEFLLKTGAGGGPQTITGGTGKFSGIQGYRGGLVDQKRWC